MKKYLNVTIEIHLKELVLFAMLLFIAALTTDLFSQGSETKDIIVDGKWVYSKKDFSGILIRNRRRYAEYDSVTIAISNNIDSLKLIRATHCVNRKKESYWEFETGTVRSFNKFGESRNNSFTKLIILDLTLK